MYISMTIIINERFVKKIGKANGVSLAGTLYYDTPMMINSWINDLCI